MSFALVSLAVVLFAGEALAQTVNNTGCGTYFSQPRIVGGNKTGYYKYPWLAMTTRYGYPVCGGTLITTSHILTAAHCYDAYSGTSNTQKYKYVLGTYNRCKYESTSKIFSASAVTIHPNYDKTTTKNDVAIVRLSTAATGFVPACLPPSVSYTARISLIMGYGTTVPGNSSSSPCELNEAEVTIFTRQEALATSLPQSVAVMEGTFAAGKINGSGVDTCQGDSGGPLVTMNQGKYTATGITSFGYGCAEPNYPGIYANVSYYLTFIRSTIGQSG